MRSARTAFLDRIPSYRSRGLILEAPGNPAEIAKRIIESVDITLEPLRMVRFRSTRECSAKSGKQKGHHRFNTKGDGLFARGDASHISGD